MTTDSPRTPPTATPTPPDVTPVSEALTWLAAQDTIAEAQYKRDIGWVWAELTAEQRVAKMGERARARDAAILNARQALTRAAADGGVAGWRNMDSAPKDGTEFWALTDDTSGNDLPPFVGRCAYHPDAGFCTDELREPILWRPGNFAAPPPPVAAGSDDLRAENERLRLAYKTGHNEGYTDATDDGTGNGYCDRDAAEEGWQQYLSRINEIQK